jgi:hypothetical protein
VLDLDTRVNLDEIVSAHLVNQEFCRSSIAISNALGQLNSIAQDCLADFLGQMSSRRNFDNLLMPALHGAISLEEVDSVSSSIGEKLHLNVTRPFQETFDEDSAITESGLGFADSAFEGSFEVGLFTNNTHTTASATHGSLDNDYF